MILDSIKLKQINTDLVREAVKRRESAVKNTIASDTGLSVATCSNVLKDLLRTGEVREIEMAPSTGGRPSRQFVYNRDFAHIAMVYVRMEGAKQFIFTGVGNLTGDEIYRNIENFDDIGLAELDGVIERLLKDFPRIHVISLGVPGVVRDGHVQTCDVGKLSYLPLGEYLSDKFHIDVVVENDVNTAALGCYQRLKGQEPEGLVYLYYPREGMAGAGIVVNGKLLRGRTEFAGEVSYMPSWINRDNQGGSQKDDLFHKYMGDILLSIDCMINPELIVLSGEWLTDSLIERIRKYIGEMSPEGHKPRFTVESDIHESYRDGLLFSGLKKLTCGMEVVRI